MIRESPVRPVCLDASLAGAIALPEALSPRALAIWKEWLTEARAIVVPPHFDAELVSSVRRAMVVGRVTPVEAEDGLRMCMMTILPNVQPRWPDATIVQRAWDWAVGLRRANIYDSLYLAIAESAGAAFWTADGNLIRSLQADGQPLPTWVHLLEP